MAVIVLEKYIGVVPVRFNLWIMLFTCCWVSYMVRVNLSINLLAMVPHTNGTSSEPYCTALKKSQAAPPHTSNKDTSEVSAVERTKDEPYKEDTFEWTVDQQALVLGSYFWAYPPTSLVGGFAAERWGPRKVVMYTTLVSGMLTMISPVAARLHYIFLICVRFLLGFCGGFVYPALHALVARWVPPDEKGKFISAMMGGTLGTVFTWSMTGVIIENWGWAFAFYVPGVLTSLWCIVWWYLVYDTPDDHPRILESERNYIKDALGDKVKKNAGLPPLKKIFTSIPFLAMVILHFGNLWGLYFIMTVGPKFVSSVLGFPLTAAGVVSALPYLARLIGATVFGSVGDYITGKKLMSTTLIRKTFTLPSHVLPGCLMVALVYAGCNVPLSVALITISMGFNGAATLTNLQNHQDLAPNFAGTLYGIANFVGSTSGFFTPMVAAYFTRHGNGFEQWRPVFYTGASVYVISAVFFVIFGSGVTQSWNYVDGPKDPEGTKPQDLKPSKPSDVKETTLSVNKND